MSVRKQIDAQVPPVLVVVRGIARSIHCGAQVAGVAVVDVDLLEQRLVEEDIVHSEHQEKRFREGRLFFTGAAIIVLEGNKDAFVAVVEQHA